MVLGNGEEGQERPERRGLERDLAVMMMIETQRVP
jgi:hypothetical protein